VGEVYVLEDRQPSLWGDTFMQQGNSTKGLESNFHYEGDKSFTTCVKSYNVILGCHTLQRLFSA
jgi:hypothetical protein